MKYTTDSIKILFASLLCYTSLSAYANELHWSFIQSINLIFHEAGHVLFFMFGQFLSVCGGTFGEFGIPLIVTLSFAWKRDVYGTGFGLWWLSTAFWSISIYARDARSQLLPLLGGESSNHDWTYILGELGLLHHEQFIANIFLTLSICSFLASIPLLFGTLKKYLPGNELPK
jgi:hypothetical protein